MLMDLERKPFHWILAGLGGKLKIPQLSLLTNLPISNPEKAASYTTCLLASYN